MAEWYLIYGFDSESELNDYKEDVKEWRKKVNPMDAGMGSLMGENLGVFLLDLEKMDSFDFFDRNEIEEFPYFVFWRIEAGFSVGHGFYDKKDMQEDDA